MKKLFRIFPRALYLQALLTGYIFFFSFAGYSQSRQLESAAWARTMLYLFHFVEWPRSFVSENMELPICLSGRLENNAQAMKFLNNTKISKWTVKIKEIDLSKDPLDGCKVIVFRNYEDFTPGPYLKALTIGVDQRERDNIPIVQIGSETNRPRIIIDLPRIRTLGLRLSSEILAMGE